MQCAHSRSCKSRNARSMKQISASNKTNTSALQLIASSTASSISLSFGSMYGSGWTRQFGGIERAWHLGGCHYDSIARKRSAEVGERLKQTSSLHRSPVQLCRLCSGAPAWRVPAPQRPRGGLVSPNMPTPDISHSFCSVLRKGFSGRHLDGQFRSLFFYRALTAQWACPYPEVN